MFNFLKKLFGVDYGSFHVHHGQHAIFVPTKIGPVQVWLEVHGHGCDGCGQMPENKVSYKIIAGGSSTCECYCQSVCECEEGILFHLDVETETCCVRWFAFA